MIGPISSLSVVFSCNRSLLITGTWPDIRLVIPVGMRVYRYRVQNKPACPAEYLVYP